MYGGFSLWGVGFCCSALRGYDTITSLLCMSNCSCFPLVTVTTQHTVPRRVFWDGFATCIRKHVLEASTKVFASWRFPGTGTLRGSIEALGPQARPVTATLATAFEGTRTGYIPAIRTKPEEGFSEVLGSASGCCWSRASDCGICAKHSPQGVQVCLFSAW